LGRVLRAISSRYEVLDEGRERVLCRARRRLERPDSSWPTFPVPGDLVEWHWSRSGGEQTGVIVAVRPRTSEIARERSGRRKHVVVANLDQLVAVVAMRDPKLDRGLLDRLLAAAERTGVHVRICFHKADLVEPGAFDAIGDVYKAAGYPLLYTSVKTGQGVPELRAALRDHITAFMGPSGAGKSHLISALQPGLRLKTGEVSEKSGRGQHTTTRVELHPTDFGGLLADTPGLRDLSLWDLAPEQLAGLFPEIQRVQENCRFTGCQHDQEPDCAVKRGVESGSIDPGRYRSYLVTLEELRQVARETARRGPRRRQS
jgi:ribosome biogenesis GTPase